MTPRQLGEMAADASSGDVRWRGDGQIGPAQEDDIARHRGARRSRVTIVQRRHIVAAFMRAMLRRLCRLHDGMPAIRRGEYLMFGDHATYR